MSINPTTLKASIDTQITNETVDFAITPSEVGGRMKDCVDYTSEQSALKENLITPTTSAQYYRGDKTFATLNKAAVNLANVDNTSDADKPISTATQVALNTKQNTLVSGTNIKTINGASVLGSGDLVVSGSSVIKQIKVSLTSSQILNLFTTPITLVPSISGKLLVPQFLFQKYNHVSSPYTTSGLFRIGLGSINFGFGAFGAVITSPDNAQGLNNFSYAQSAAASPYQELPIVIGATVANPTSGDGNLELYLTYIEITI